MSVLFKREVCNITMTQVLASAMLCYKQYFMGGGLSKDNAQECEDGSALHGSSVDKAGTSA